MRRIAALLAVFMTLALSTLALSSVATAKVDAVFTARLNPLNDSGAGGNAVIQLRGDKLTVKVNVHGVEARLPHLQHSHGFDGSTDGVCPPRSADTNGNGLVEVGEGAPFYGDQFKVTLSETGAQEPLNLDIAPVANRGGAYNYRQTFTISDPDLFDLSDETIVVHGIDLNGNGAYDDFLEASLPALCGEIVQRR